MPNVYIYLWCIIVTFAIKRKAKKNQRTVLRCLRLYKNTTWTKAVCLPKIYRTITTPLTYFCTTILISYPVTLLSYYPNPLLSKLHVITVTPNKCAPAILLLTCNWSVPGAWGLHWHNVHTKFRKNRSTCSKFETTAYRVTQSNIWDIYKIRGSHSCHYGE